MINISILALQNAVMGSISDSAYVFNKVNEFLKEAGKPHLFKIQLVGFTPEIKFDNGLYTVKPDAIFESVKRTDLIIIPSLKGHLNTTVYLNKDCCVWLANQYKGGAEVAALCTGSFLMAFSGILNNKQCTTHWAYANEFRYYYPGITLLDEKMITDQDGLYSSGGSTAYWNLLIHLVEKYTDRSTAIRAAKFFVVDLDKNDQSPFVIFNGLKDHNDKSILKAQKFIEKIIQRN